MIYCLLLGVETFQEFFNNNKNEREIERRNVFRFLLSPHSLLLGCWRLLTRANSLLSTTNLKLGEFFFAFSIGGVATQKKFIAFCYGD